MTQEKKPVYIVISQTGTILSRILKYITHEDYNHASISLNENLDIMYSFGRKNPYNPFWAGFVKESKDFGTFKRFSNAKILVLRLYLSAEEYENVQDLIRFMTNHPEIYGYNYLGLYLAALKIHFKRNNRYYCSEFVKDVLVKQNVEGASELEKIIHPMSFLNLPNSEIVYCGKYTNYIPENDIATYV